MRPDSRLHHLLLLLLLLLLLAVTVAASADWPERLEQVMRDLRQDINVRLLADVQQLRPRLRQPVVAEVEVEVADGTGRRWFRLRDARAVDASVGVTRTYRVTENSLFSQVCTFRGGGGDDDGGQACARHYKPAFYGLVAASGLLAALLVTLGVGCRRRSAASGDAASGSGPGGLLVQCDPLMAATVCGHEIVKIPV